MSNVENSLTEVDVKKLIDIRFHDYLRGEDLSVSWCDAAELINFNRLDIVIKISYLKSIVNSSEVDFKYYESLYLSTIELFTQGSFKEPGMSKKSSAVDFVTAFNHLYSEMKTGGFDIKHGVLPVTKDFIPLDGAHRLAIAYVLGLKVPYVTLPNITCKYDVDYFERAGATPNLIYQLLNEYVKYDNSVKLGIAWPFGELQRSELEEVYGGELIYLKNLQLTKVGLKNLCTIAYHNEAWAGSEIDCWSGIDAKSERCFGKGGETRVFIFKANTHKDNVELKERLRAGRNASKHIVHTTDNTEETKELLDVLLHDYSGVLLNGLELKSLSRLYITFKENQLLNKKSIVISGSSLLSIIGLRDSQDIDVIHSCDVIPDNILGSHNEYAHLYKHSLEEIINYDYLTINILGLKFLNFEELLFFKKQRAESKDIQDFKLLNDFLKGNTSNFKFAIRKVKSNLGVLYRQKKVRLVVHIIRVLKLLGLFNIVKYAYNIFK